jgi:hypothetical protein
MLADQVSREHRVREVPQVTLEQLDSKVPLERGARLDKQAQEEILVTQGLQDQLVQQALVDNKDFRVSLGQEERMVSQGLLDQLGQQDPVAKEVNQVNKGLLVLLDLKEPLGHEVRLVSQDKQVQLDSLG